MASVSDWHPVPKIEMMIAGKRKRDIGFPEWELEKKNRGKGFEEHRFHHTIYLLRRRFNYEVASCFFG